MKENKAVGPNLQTYYYYTNAMADESKVKGVIILATGMEGSGSLYDEIGDYLDTKGYALYAIDELGYGKTGEVKKKTDYKNWKAKSAHFAAYNVHALSVLAKHNHSDAPVYLVGNDFGAMLSLYVIKEFPEVIDKVVTIGWGAPRLQDYCFLFNSWVKKLFLYDDGQTKLAHWSKNKRYAFRFERGSKYSWLTSDKEQLEKIQKAGYLDTAGTIGHYYYYFKFKVKIPFWTRLRKKCDKNTPILLISGNNDLSTLNGRTTRGLERFFNMKKFTNVSSLIVDGRHELLFESNRFAVVDQILSWLGNNNELVVRSEVNNKVVVAPKAEDIEIVTNNKEEKVQEVVVEANEVPTQDTLIELQEAEDELLLSTHKEEK